MKSKADKEPCFCDRMNIGEPGASCGDCPTRDYKRTDERSTLAILAEEVRAGLDRLRRDVVYSCQPIDVMRAYVALDAIDALAKQKSKP